MADNLPVNFPIPAENSIATYNYVDIADGTGIMSLYAFTTKATTTISYHIGGNDVYSNDIVSNSATPTSTSTYDLLTTWTFDMLAFNASRTLRGTSIFNIPWGAVTDGGSSDYGGIFYFVAELFKVSGGSETSLGSVTSESLHPANLVSKYKLSCVKIAISNTVFKANDNLRLKIYAYGKLDGSSSQNHVTMSITHDPKNRETGAWTIANLGSTKLELYIPEKLDL